MRNRILAALRSVHRGRVARSLREHLSVSQRMPRTQSPVGISQAWHNQIKPLPLGSARPVIQDTGSGGSFNAGTSSARELPKLGSDVGSPCKQAANEKADPRSLTCAAAASKSSAEL